MRRMSEPFRGIQKWIDEYDPRFESDSVSHNTYCNLDLFEKGTYTLSTSIGQFATEGVLEFDSSKPILLIDPLKRLERPFFMNNTDWYGLIFEEDPFTPFFVFVTDELIIFTPSVEY